MMFTTSLMLALCGNPGLSEVGDLRSRFGLRTTTFISRGWQNKTIDVLGGVEATWQFDWDRFGLEIEVGARVPISHESEPHVDIVGGLIASAILTRAPRLTLGIGADAVLLTGVAFVGPVGIEGDAVGQIAVRIVDGREFAWDLGLRVEQASV